MEKAAPGFRWAWSGGLVLVEQVGAGSEPVSASALLCRRVREEASWSDAQWRVWIEADRRRLDEDWTEPVKKHENTEDQKHSSY